MKLAFCIPGKQQSMEWTKSWDMLKNYMFRNDIEHYLYQWYDSNIYGCRNSLVSRDAEIPWDMMPCFLGAPYDYMVWIDSDMGFEPDDVMRLVESGKDIISAVCPMGPTNRCPAGSYGLDDNGVPVCRYLNIKVLDTVPKDELIEVQYAGFGFIVVKYGVFEAMDYPWFRSITWTYERRKSDPSEDLGFCLRAGMKGFKVFLHPWVRVSHTKEMCLTA